VVDVHDLHVWTLTSDMDAASAHLMIGDGADAHGVLDAARHLLGHEYHIAHATLQVEPDTHDGCHEVTW
jgi:cobalt-zinc-cadmium efflux system protein